MQPVKIDQPIRFIDGLAEVLGGLYLLGLICLLIVFGFCL